jgi:CheY-like chemotaxis protein
LRSRGRVLVVDDEPLVAKVVRHALEAKHDVTVFTAAAEALAVLRAGQRFDVIICDMMMPQMTGADFYEALLAFAPACAERIVFLTGGAFSIAAREFLDRVPNPKVDKPFVTSEFRALVDRRVARSRQETAR